MTVQELIDKLMLIEDKTITVLDHYEAWYNNIISLEEVELFTDDNETNIVDYRQPNDESHMYLLLKRSFE